MYACKYMQTCKYGVKKVCRNRSRGGSRSEIGCCWWGCIQYIVSLCCHANFFAPKFLLMARRIWSSRKFWKSVRNGRSVLGNCFRSRRKMIGFTATGSPHRVSLLWCPRGKQPAFSGISQIAFKERSLRWVRTSMDVIHPQFLVLLCVFRVWWCDDWIRLMTVWISICYAQ